MQTTAAYPDDLDLRRLQGQRQESLAQIADFGRRCGAYVEVLEVAEVGAIQVVLTGEVEQVGVMRGRLERELRVLGVLLSTE